MKKSNIPFGLSLPPEFKEVVKRIKNKDPELDILVERDPDLKADEQNGEPDKTDRPLEGQGQEG